VKAKLPPPGPPALPDLSDMDRIHANIASGRLGRLFDHLGQLGMQTEKK
jgi:hypothetical protein